MKRLLVLLFYIPAMVFGSEALDLRQQLPSQEQHNGFIKSKRYYAGLNVTEVLLNNGMKVFLKPTKEDGDEAYVRLFAKGGYTSFPQACCSLASLAVATGLESGVGNLTIEQQSVFLYENCIEFYPKIEANYRSIDGSVPIDALEDYLEFMHAYFLQHRFYENEFDNALKAMHPALTDGVAPTSKEIQYAMCRTDSEAIYAANCASSQKISREHFAFAKEIYQKSFSNPAEYVCVIVGDFSAAEIEKALVKSLGTIPLPASEKIMQWSVANDLDFPVDVVHKVVRVNDRNDCAVRMTFPVNRKMSPDCMSVFKLACKVVENRLNRMGSPDSSAIISTNVQDELPLYPSLETVWMSIQFRCNRKDADRLLQEFADQVRRLQNEGPFPAEVEELRVKQIECRLEWMNSNEFWLTTLTNCTLWGAGLDFMLDDPLNKSTVFEAVRSFFQQSLQTDRYITVSVVP